MTLTDLKKLADAATPGPWEVTAQYGDQDIWNKSGLVFRMTRCDAPADADFIAACREMVPKLIAVAEAAESALIEIQLALQDYHAPAYKSADLLRQLEPLLCSALSALNPPGGGE